MQILSKIAPAVAAGESSTQPNSALMQLLRLAWGYKEVNDDHLDKVSAAMSNEQCVSMFEVCIKIGNSRWMDERTTYIRANLIIKCWMF